VNDLAVAAAPRFGLVAGEASGDLLGGLLLQALRARWPSLQAFGVGGPQLRAQGLQAWWPSERLAVNGFADALAHVPALWAMRRRLGGRLLLEQPALFIGIDAPDFNLGLEKRLKSGGLRCVHFVCPSIWAWRSGRAARLAASADLVLCLFPFEPELLQRHGVAAAFVGHPLADVIPLQPSQADARAALGLPSEATVVALLPGSRGSEVTRLGPRFVEAARRLHQRRPQLRFVLPAAPGMRGRLAPMLAGQPPLPLTVLDGRSHEALAACDLALVASGTATLEAALFKRPMVIAYHTHALNWWIVEHFVHTRWAGLPNILCGEAVVPELLQDAATPEAIAAEIERLLDDPARAAAMRARFTALHLQLRRDTARAATDAIAQILAR
jgi:lipid-A-disaccharide synthase